MSKNNYFKYQRLTFSPPWNDNKYKSEEGINMTIIIGALCDEGKSVILVADKLITYPAQMVILENVEKSKKITKNSMILISGSPSNTIFLDSSLTSAKAKTNIKDIANQIASDYRSFVIERISHQYLPYAGFHNFSDFQLKQASLHRDVIRELMGYITTFNLFVDLILGGLDNDGNGHIFYITNPGVVYCHDHPGFFCAGAGANRANPIFEFCDYSPNMSKEKVLEIVYLAKKRTEPLGGIGKDTDVWIIDESGTGKAGAKLISKLEENYKEHKIFSLESLGKINIEKGDIEPIIDNLFS